MAVLTNSFLENSMYLLNIHTYYLQLWLKAAMVVLEELDCSTRLMNRLFKHEHNWTNFV